MKSTIPILVALVLVLLIGLADPNQVQAQMTTGGSCSSANVDTYAVCQIMKDVTLDAMSDGFSVASSFYDESYGTNWCAVYIGVQIAHYNESLGVVKERYGDLGLAYYCFWFNVNATSLCLDYLGGDRNTADIFHGSHV